MESPNSGVILKCIEELKSYLNDSPKNIKSIKSRIEAGFLEKNETLFEKIKLEEVSDKNLVSMYRNIEEILYSFTDKEIYLLILNMEVKRNNNSKKTIKIHYYMNNNPSLTSISYSEYY